MADLIGTWKFESTDNIVGFLKASGLPDSEIKEWSDDKPTEIFSKAGDKWTLLYKSNKKDYPTTFKLGEEFKELEEGYDTINVITSDSSTHMRHEQKWEYSGQKGSTLYVRKRQGNKMILTMESNGVKATRTYIKA